MGRHPAASFAEHLDRLRQQLRVRHDQSVPIARLDDRVAPSDLLDLSLHLVFELDPISLVDGIVHLERESTHDVSERRLERQPYDRRHDRGCGEDAGNVHSRSVHEPPDREDVSRADGEVVHDVGIVPAHHVER